MFVQGESMVNVLAWVDILVSSSDDELFKCTKQMLSDSFKMKDLGTINKFLGIEFAPLNVPMERRLQTLVVLFHTLTFTLWPVLCILL